MFGMSGGMSGAIHKPTRVIPQRGRDCCPFLRSKSRKFDVVRPKYRFTKPRHSSFVIRHASCVMRHAPLAARHRHHWTLDPCLKNPRGGLGGTESPPASAQLLAPANRREGRKEGEQDEEDERDEQDARSRDSRRLADSLDSPSGQIPGPPTTRHSCRRNEVKNVFLFRDWNRGRVTW